jgi:hypothetical protein
VHYLKYAPRRRHRLHPSSPVNKLAEVKKKQQQNKKAMARLLLQRTADWDNARRTQSEKLAKPLNLVVLGTSSRLT